VNQARRISRWRAASIHFCFTLALALVALALLFGVWFPQPFTQAAGADRLIMLLIGIDLVLGPLLTLIVYRQGKRGMLFDLWVIATVQVTALVYGMIMIAQSRPIFVVVTADMTYLVSNRSLSDDDLEQAPTAGLRSRSWLGPVLVAAPAPTDRKQRDALLNSSLAGKDIDRLPAYYRPYASAGIELVSKSRALAELVKLTSATDAVTRFVKEQAVPIEQLHFQPLRGRDPDADTTLVFDTRTAEIVGVIPVDPWIEAKP